MMALTAADKLAIWFWPVTGRSSATMADGGFSCEALTMGTSRLELTRLSAGPEPGLRLCDGETGWLLPGEVVPALAWAPGSGGG